MDFVNLAKRRIQAVLRGIDGIAASEFPYKASKHALDSLRAFFQEELTSLEKLDPVLSNRDVIKTACKNTLTRLYEYLPLLGWIVRSTNVRNAYELHGPLTRLARQVVSKNMQLVLSSEWEYSPLTLMEPRRLRDFAFIGFPAHESSNPLIAPLAGHELGHAIWVQDNNLLWKAGFESKLQQSIVSDVKKDLDKLRAFAPEIGEITADCVEDDWTVEAAWSPAFEWAKQQCEEYFCDFAGIRMFGASYFHAFSYLLSPRLQSQRPFHYPNLRRRVRAHCQAAKVYGIRAPLDYQEWFEDFEEPIEREAANKAFLLKLADQAADRLIDDLIQHADDLLTSPTTVNWREVAVQSIEDTEEDIPIPSPIEAAIEKVMQDFDDLVPAEESGGLPVLLNAAWRVTLNGGPKNALAGKDPDLVLRELLLKSIEVLEFEARCSSQNAPQT